MKKVLKFFSSLLAVAVFILMASPAIAMAWDAPIHTVQLSMLTLSVLMSFMHVQGMFLTGPDVSGITTDKFLTVAKNIIRKKVNAWLIGSEAQKYINVKTPMALPKLEAVGNPRPYREQDDFTDGGKFTDRILTVYQSKWDWKFNPENLRNKYLAEVASGTIDALKTTFFAWIAEQIAREYLSDMINDTVYLGEYDAAGSDAADIADGWGTIIAAEILGGDITPVVTGAITSANAVDKVELVAEAVPSSWRDEDGMFPIICSWGTLDKYKKHYRTAYGFSFNKNDKGQYAIDGLNAVLTPRSYMGTSQRLIAVQPGNLVYGTDSDGVDIFITPHLDLLQVRMKMPIGFQIGDLERIIVNDQA